jgi:hypothetical protein
MIIKIDAYINQIPIYLFETAITILKKKPNQIMMTNLKLKK